MSLDRTKKAEMPPFTTFEEEGSVRETYESLLQPIFSEEKCANCQNETQTRLSTVIEALPPLVVVSANERTQPLEAPDRLWLSDSAGTHEYKLIGVVDELFKGHVVAKLKLEDGNCYCINDYIREELREKHVSSIDFDRSFKNRKLCFYERIRY